MSIELATLDHWATAHGVLAAAALATCGWLYTARRARHLARKQHTLNLASQQLFNKEFRDAWATVSDALRDARIPDIGVATPEGAALQWVLNYFELVAAGVRSGDFDEQLVRDTSRGALLSIWAACEPKIMALRSTRARAAIYEHLEWLRDRWCAPPPGWVRALEWVRGKPFSGRRRPFSYPA